MGDTGNFRTRISNRIWVNFVPLWRSYYMPLHAITSVVLYQVSAWILDGATLGNLPFGDLEVFVVGH